MIVVFVLTVASCNQKSSVAHTIVTESDTVKVMRLLLDSAFYRQNLPSISALTRNSRFGDTIMFCSETYEGDSNIARYFPQTMQHIKIRFFTRPQICSLAIKSYNSAVYLPNFLQISSFKKEGSAYEVSLENTCVIPSFKKEAYRTDGKGNPEARATLPCVFGLLCGGGIGMTSTKRGTRNYQK